MDNEIKHMIISNFIAYYTTIQVERDDMEQCLNDYIAEDHVNELEGITHANT